MWKSVMIFVSVLALATTSIQPAAAQMPNVFPAVIPLPNGFRPEGIAVGRDTSFYVGSLAAGAIYKGNLRTGVGAVLVPDQADRIAVGLGLDLPGSKLFAAGGPTGEGYVYDAGTGASLAAYEFAESESFVNDVVVTRDAAYFTDSFRPFLYRVPLGPGGALPDQSAVTEIPLGGDFVFVPGAFNANGIDATPDGKSLIVVNTSSGVLYLVNPESGDASAIDLGGDTVPRGDGILLDGLDLYVVQNRLNQIAVVRLDADLASGSIARTITNPNFRIPTTVGELGNDLYAVNARFGDPPTPETDYEVVKVSKR